MLGLGGRAAGAAAGVVDAVCVTPKCAPLMVARADFDARFQKFGAEAKAAQASVKDLDTFKASFSGLTKNCGGCHETYRAKKN